MTAQEPLCVCLHHAGSAKACKVCNQSTTMVGTAEVDRLLTQICVSVGMAQQRNGEVYSAITLF